MARRRRYRRRTRQRRSQRRFRRRSRRSTRTAGQLAPVARVGTTVYPHAFGTGFRGRRMTGRRFRSILWRDTLSQTHWRSTAQAASAVLFQGASAGQGPVYFVPSISIAGINSTDVGLSTFWTSGGGGLVPKDPAVVPGLFAGDIVIRGGMCRMVVTVDPTNTCAYRCKFWVVKTIKYPDVNVLNRMTAGGIAGSQRQAEWDPTLEPDFTNLFGKVLFSKEVLLPFNPAASASAECQFRIRVQKIDQFIFQGTEGVASGDTYYWFVQLVPVIALGALVTNKFNFMSSFNLTFVGDQIGTT